MARGKKGGKKTKKVETVEDWPSFANVHGKGKYAGLWWKDNADDPEGDEVLVTRDDDHYIVGCDADGNATSVPRFASNTRVTVEISDEDAGNPVRAAGVILDSLISNPVRGAGSLPPRKERIVIGDLRRDMAIGHKTLKRDGHIKNTRNGWKVGKNDRARKRGGSEPKASAADAGSDDDSDGSGSDSGDSDGDVEDDAGERVYARFTLPFNELGVEVSNTATGTAVYLQCGIVREDFSTPEAANRAMELALTYFSVEYMRLTFGVKDAVASRGFEVVTTSGTQIPLPLASCPPSRASRGPDDPPCALYLEDVAKIQIKSQYSERAYAFHKSGETEADLNPPGFAYRMPALDEDGDAILKEDGEPETEEVFTDFIGLVDWALTRIGEDEAVDFDRLLVLKVQGFLGMRSFSFSTRSKKHPMNPSGVNLSFKNVRVLRAIALDASFETKDSGMGNAPAESTAASKQHVLDDAADF